LVSILVPPNQVARGDSVGRATKKESTHSQVEWVFCFWGRKRQHRDAEGAEDSQGRRKGKKKGNKEREGKGLTQRTRREEHRGHREDREDREDGRRVQLDEGEE
jgi:hypothetical protein